MEFTLNDSYFAIDEINFVRISSLEILEIGSVNQNVKMSSKRSMLTKSSRKASVALYRCSAGHGASSRCSSTQSI